MLSKQAKKRIWKYGILAVVCLFVLYVLLSIFLSDQSVSAFHDEGLTLSEPEQEGTPITDTFSISNENLKMDFNVVDCLLTVQDLKSGKVFRSSPEILDTDDINALAMVSLMTPVSIEYCTRNQNNTQNYDINYYEFFTAYEIKSGFAMKVNLTDIGISFVVEFRLKDNYLEILVPDKSIKEEGENILLSVTVLPLMDAARQGEEGYTVLPDGIGGLTYYNKEHNIYENNGYSKPIYGENVTFSNKGNDDDTNVLLPFFGIVKKDTAVLAVMEEAAAESNITLSPPSYREMGFYRTNFTMKYRDSFITDSDVSGKSDIAYESERIKTDRKVRYYFLSGEEMSYVQVADAYSSYLESKGTAVSEKESEMLIRFFMMTQGLSTGFISNDVVMTTFDQAQQMMEELGTGMSYEIAGWYKEGYGAGLPKQFPPNGKIGGKKGAQALTEYAKSKQIDVMFETDNFTSLSTTDIRIREYGVLKPDSKLFGQNLTLVNGLIEESTANLLNVKEAQTRFAKNQKQFQSLGVNALKMQVVGSTLMTDFNQDHPFRRSQQAEEYIKMVEEAKSNGFSVSVDYGNGYMIGHADRITGVPFESSNSYMVDETVPIYSLAVSKYVTLCSDYINQYQNSRESIMKAFEYGLVPAFELTHENTELLKDTGYTHLFSSAYADWKDTVNETNASFTQLKEGGYQIVSHQKLAEDVFLTKYKNGKQAVFNYSDSVYRYANTEIQAESFKILSGEGGIQQ